MPTLLVETTGCRFTPAPQSEQELGARPGFRLPENSLDSAGGLGLGPCSLFFQTCHKRDVRVGGRSDPLAWSDRASGVTA